MAIVAAGSDKRQAAADCAVLCSAGLDSAVLVAHAAREGRVLPLYVSVGLAWEDAERQALARLARTPAFMGNGRGGRDASHGGRDASHRRGDASRAAHDSGNGSDASGGRGVLPPVTLQFDMRDVYPPTHWAIKGEPPAFDTPDEDVYIVGRNVVLLTKAAVCAASRGIPTIAIGPLAGNPFPDATPEFFASMAKALSLGLDRPLTIVAPFAEMDKSEVIRLGMSLGVDLSLTLSCMNPQAGGAHCGRCSKCRERRDAFNAAGIEDPTVYASVPPR